MGKTTVNRKTNAQKGEGEIKWKVIRNRNGRKDNERKKEERERKIKNIGVIEKSGETMGQVKRDERINVIGRYNKCDRTSQNW